MQRLLAPLIRIEHIGKTIQETMSSMYELVFPDEVKVRHIVDIIIADGTWAMSHERDEKGEKKVDIDAIIKDRLKTSFPEMTDDKIGELCSDVRDKALKLSHKK